MPTERRWAVSYRNTSIRRFDRTILWLWNGLIVQGAITLLAAPEKTGKTTLLSLLLDRRREGGQLLGRKVEPGRTILCSEEEMHLWALRQPPLDFGPQFQFHRPLGPNPTPGRWRRFIDHLLELGNESFDLLVIDSIMNFLPASPNNPSAMRKALHELRVVSGMPVGVLLLHQTYGVRSRGRARGPLAAFADILIDMQVSAGDRFTRRRQFTGVGRYPGTLQHVGAELNPEGTDYLLVADDPLESAAGGGLETLCGILRDSPVPLTRQEILAKWPTGEHLPRADSLWRSLTHGCQAGLFVRTGAGTKTEAFRYALAKREPDK
jgi:hypothetical protein